PGFARGGRRRLHHPRKLRGIDGGNALSALDLPSRRRYNARMQTTRLRILSSIVAAAAIVALVLGDMLPTLATAEELPVTAVPATELVVPAAEARIHVAQRK